MTEVFIVVRIRLHKKYQRASRVKVVNTILHYCHIYARSGMQRMRVKIHTV